jgi:hypothetical protein
VLLVSDGGDNHSRYSLSEVRQQIDEGAVEVYAVNIAEPWFCPRHWARAGWAALRRRIRASTPPAGTSRWRTSASSPEAVNGISPEIRSQYTVPRGARAPGGVTLSR